MNLNHLQVVRGAFAIILKIDRLFYVLFAFLQIYMLKVYPMEKKYKTHKKRLNVKKEYIPTFNQDTGCTYEDLVSYYTWLVEHNALKKYQHQLIKEEIEEVIHNTAVSVYMQMHNGNLDKFHFNIFKSYAYRAINVNMLNLIERKEKLKNKIIDFDDYIQTNDIPDDFQLEEEDDNVIEFKTNVQTILKNLTEIEQEIITRYLAGHENLSVEYGKVYINTVAKFKKYLIRFYPVLKNYRSEKDKSEKNEKAMKEMITENKTLKTIIGKYGLNPLTFKMFLLKKHKQGLFPNYYDYVRKTNRTKNEKT